MNDRLTVFLSASFNESAQAARALRMAGYRVVDPFEHGGIDDDVMEECDMLVTTPFSTADWTSYDDATVAEIGDLVPNWKSA